MTVSLPCRLLAGDLHKKDLRDSFFTLQAVSSKFTPSRKMCVTVSLPSRLCARIFHNRIRCLLEVYTRKTRVKISLLCGCHCVPEICARKECMTDFLPGARSLHQDVCDSFFLVKAACSKLKMCVTASSPCRSSVGSVLEVCAGKMFVTVSSILETYTRLFLCRLCALSLHNHIRCMLEVYTRKMNTIISLLRLFVQAVCSKLTQERYA